METLKLKKIYILMFFLPLMMISCEEETEMKEVTLSRLFRPVNLSAGVNGNQVTLEWAAVGDGLYSLEVSKDSLLFTNEVQVFSVEGAATYWLDNLQNLTVYSARVKAVSSNPATEDSGWIELAFETGQENIFFAVPDEDIGVNTVLLKWKNGKEVSHIVVSSEGDDDVILNLSTAEISASEKLLEGLNPGTAYSFSIYLGEMLRGTIMVTTKS